MTATLADAPSLARRGTARLEAEWTPPLPTGTWLGDDLEDGSPQPFSSWLIGSSCSCPLPGPCVCGSVLE